MAQQPGDECLPRTEPARHTDGGSELRLAAAGDTDAFVRFYDQTVPKAYLLARLATSSPDTAQRVADLAYSDAWIHAAAHPATGLSAQAWLLSLVQQRARETRDPPRHVPKPAVLAVLTTKLAGRRTARRPPDGW